MMSNRLALLCFTILALCAGCGAANEELTVATLAGHWKDQGTSYRDYDATSHHHLGEVLFLDDKNQLQRYAAPVAEPKRVAADELVAG